MNEGSLQRIENYRKNKDKNINEEEKKWINKVAEVCSFKGCKKKLTDGEKLYQVSGFPLCRHHQNFIRWINAKNENKEDNVYFNCICCYGQNTNSSESKKISLQKFENSMKQYGIYLCDNCQELMNSFLDTIESKIKENGMKVNKTDKEHLRQQIKERLTNKKDINNELTLLEANKINFITRKPLKANGDDLNTIVKEIDENFDRYLLPVICFVRKKICLKRKNCTKNRRIHSQSETANLKEKSIKV